MNITETSTDNPRARSLQSGEWYKSVSADAVTQSREGASAQSFATSRSSSPASKTSSAGKANRRSPGDSRGRAGREPAVGQTELREAEQELRAYRAAREELDARVRDNRSFWRMTRRAERANDSDPGAATGWLFNSVANKHADAMDSIPEPCVLPREEEDTAEAQALSEILPVILDSCGFEELYSEQWWSKLIDGSAVTGVFWSPEAAGGRGDIALGALDLLNIYWEPGVRDIQDSRSVFTLERVGKKKLCERWPQLEGRLGADGEYACVTDRYYKKNGRLHFFRYVGDELLYASENDPACAQGWYRHGQYPFVIDTMYPDAGGLCGFGAVDAAKSAQRGIDRLDSVIMKNALASSRPRYFVRVDGGVSEEEFSDTENELVHVSSSALGEDSIRQITAVPLSGIYADVLKLKINELKETTGNRDFTQGSVSGGVTSGTAIAALQEAGSKLSRDLIKGSYRALSRACLLIIELIREFYTSPRSFRVRAGSGCRCVRYVNTALNPAPAGVICGLDEPRRLPCFDVRVEQCKASPFSREVANERAMLLWQSGFFRKENRAEALAALGMMDFEGKEKLVQRLSCEGGEDGAGAAYAEARAADANPLRGAAARIDSARRVTAGGRS